MHLSPDCHLAVVADDLVFLDARRGVYLCLPGSAGSVVRGRDGEMAVYEPSLQERLSNAGMLSSPHPGSNDRSLAAPPDRQERDLPDGRPARFTIPAIADLLIVYFSATWRFRVRSFGAVVEWARRSGCTRQVRAGDLFEDVRLFQVCLPWLPFQGRCLLRSFLLLEFLRRRGHAEIRWVFGVATWPFSAHCWLQIGSAALDDQVGRLTRYTPIMAV